jgi:hypothetical protein
MSTVTLFPPSTSTSTDGLQASDMHASSRHSRPAAFKAITLGPQCDAFLSLIEKSIENRNTTPAYTKVVENPPGLSEQRNSHKSEEPTGHGNGILETVSHRQVCSHAVTGSDTGELVGNG